MSNQVNLKKLQNSKWTRLNPQNKEKHYSVVKVERHESDKQKVQFVVLEAALSKRKLQVGVTELKDSSQWVTGWK